MTIEPRHEDRILRRDRIDELSGRQRRRVPDGMVPLAADDPLSRPDLLPVFADAPRELLRRCGVPELNARQLESAVDEVRVIIDESRDRETALQIDDRSVRADVGPGADSHDSVALDSYRLGPGPLRIAGPDFSIRENHGRQNGEHSVWRRDSS